MNLTPTRGNVLILPDKAEQKTVGGIYKADTSKDKPQKGTVIATGIPEAKYEELFLQYGASFETGFKEGAKVYYKKWSGDTISEEGKEYVIVKFEDVLAVIS